MAIPVPIDNLTAMGIPDSPTMELSTFKPHKMFELHGRTAVITGAAGGIGRWLAAALGANGASVALVDVDEQSMKQLASDLSSGGVQCSVHPVDLLRADAAAVVEQIRMSHDTIDILVNCAAINTRTPIMEAEAGDYDRILELNLSVPYFLSRAVVRVMPQRGGSIIHIGSINSAYGLAGVSIYGPAKAALSQLTRVQAIEWAQLGVRVNCLAPGFIHTPLTEPLLRDSKRLAWILSRVPMGRFGHPRELTGQLLVLASDAGSFITGQTYYIDGGFLAGGDWGVA